MEVKSSECSLAEKNDTKLKKNKNGKKWFMKRAWEDSSREVSESDPKKPFERIKKKKVAMLLGYCGVDYFGMQRNPGVKTIEEDLLKALLEAKYISEEDFKNQQNAQFQRSSRTDKGVSAVRQVVSVKLPLEVDIEEINKRLPECIKVFSIKKVTKRFNSKVSSNARSYSYTLPTYVFEPSIKTLEEKKSYRITSEKLKEVNDALSFYKGSKSYYNFTEKKQFNDPSSLRYMMSFSVEKVFVKSDMEFAVLIVKGQSFMIHQIRKMVGLTIAIVRGLAPISIMDKVFTKEKVMIPVAPGLGLVLEMVHYDRYDDKFQSTHDTLKWDDVEESVQKFKDDHIFPVIVKGEVEEDSMGLWLEKLDSHNYVPAEDNDQETKDESLVSEQSLEEHELKTNSSDENETLEGDESI